MDCGFQRGLQFIQYFMYHYLKKKVGNNAVTTFVIPMTNEYGKIKVSLVASVRAKGNSCRRPFFINV